MDQDLDDLKSQLLAKVGQQEYDAIMTQINGEWAMMCMVFAFMVVTVGLCVIAATQWLWQTKISAETKVAFKNVIIAIFVTPSVRFKEWAWSVYTGSIFFFFLIKIFFFN